MGAARECLGENASCQGVGRLGLAAFPRPTARPWGVRPGSASPTGCVCGGYGRWDPSPTPQRALLRAGFARCGGGTRVPGGGAICLRLRRPGLGAPPRPTVCPWGVRPSPTTHWLWVRGMWAWGPVTNPTARALASWLCAMWGGTRAPGGGASCLCVGLLGLGTIPGPTPRPWGVRPGPTTHWLSVRGMRAWGPVTHSTARALASRLCALWGRHEGARGGGILPGCEASGVGCYPRRSRWSLGRAAGPHYPLAVGAGGVGVGTRHQRQSVRSCELALHIVGAAEGRPGAGASCLCVGRPE